MITRRTLLKGAAAGVITSVAASALIRDHKTEPLTMSLPHDCSYGCGVEYKGFGLVQAKPEGESVPFDPQGAPAWHEPYPWPSFNGSSHQS